MLLYSALGHDLRAGVPDVFGGGALFGVRRPAQGGVCQCIDICLGDIGLFPFQAFWGCVNDGDEAGAYLRHVRVGRYADAGVADGREDAL